MKIRVNFPRSSTQSHQTWVKLERMLSPLCGLIQKINIPLLKEVSPPLVTSGAELTGVHVVLGKPPPPIGSYHIGGMGLSLDDTLIRTLAESTERYAQLTVGIFGMHEITLETHGALVATGRNVLEERHCSLFLPGQYSRPGFPFSPFDPSQPLGWIEGFSMTGKPPCLLPAQLVFVGYNAQTSKGEPNIWSAVTTGTAAHITHDRALVNALLELIQIDCAVGHWYSSWQARRILLDKRLEWVDQVIRRSTVRGIIPKFYLLPSPDLPGFTVACIFRPQFRAIPCVAIGLGCSLNLGNAIYKAWLEAIGVRQLANINVLQGGLDQIQTTDNGEPCIYDLDTNVAWYASGQGTRLIDNRFESSEPISAVDLPPDVDMEADSAVSHLVEAFRATGKDLYRWDLTLTDIAELGFVVERVWSPDTLSLPLPSAPQLCHDRFKQYGKVMHDHPHPYP